MIGTHGSDTMAHHAANAAAVAIPVGAYLLDAEPYLVFTATVAGLLWYAVLFYDRFFKSNATTVTETTTKVTVIEPPKGNIPAPVTPKE